MVFSEFVPNHEFGMLATIILVVALTGSLVLLPVLINFIQPQFRFSVDKK
jgi:predicted RND superfamily exporter protein